LLLLLTSKDGLRSSSSLEHPLPRNLRLSLRALVLGRRHPNILERQLLLPLPSKKFGVLDVPVVKGSKLVLPSLLLLSGEVRVDVPDGVLEDLNLLDERLQRLGVRFESRFASSTGEDRLLLLAHLFNPHPNDLLQPPGREEAEDRVLPPLLRLPLSLSIAVLLHPPPQLTPPSQPLHQSRKLVLRCRKRAREDEHLLPILQFSILHDVAQIAPDDRLEDAEVRLGRRATGEVGLLSRGQEGRRTGLEREEERIGVVFRGERERHGRLKVAEHERLGDERRGVRCALAVLVGGRGRGGGVERERVPLETGAGGGRRGAADRGGNGSIAGGRVVVVLSSGAEVRRKCGGRRRLARVEGTEEVVLCAVV